MTVKSYDNQIKNAIIFMKTCFDISIMFDNLWPGRNINQSHCWIERKYRYLKTSRRIYVPHSDMSFFHASFFVAKVKTCYQ